MAEKVVLAYSGGLDTSIIIPWLNENYGYEVIAFIAVGRRLRRRFAMRRRLRAGLLLQQCLSRQRRLERADRKLDHCRHPGAVDVCAPARRSDGDLLAPQPRLGRELNKRRRRPPFRQRRLPPFRSCHPWAFGFGRLRSNDEPRLPTLNRHLRS